MAVAFHPEITGDDRLHRLFVESVRAAGFRLATLQTA
jgi:glutamine amidotransferase PdxT